MGEETWRGASRPSPRRVAARVEGALQPQMRNGYS